MLTLIKVFSNIAHGDTTVTSSAKLSIFHLIVSLLVRKMGKKIYATLSCLTIAELVIENGISYS